MIQEIINEVKGKKILILGLGREGISTYNFITKYLEDADITLADTKINMIVEKNNIKINKQKLINLIDYDYILKEFDIIFKSPGISFKDVNIKGYEYKINSELNMFLKYSKSRTIGITGTKGKSTTSTLLYSVISKEISNCVLIGNIGIPVFDCIETIDSDTIVIIEMSSHQLEFVRYSPYIATILNIFPEHLDHYNNYEDYIKAKLNIAINKENTKYFLYEKSLKKYCEKIEIENRVEVSYNKEKSFYGYYFEEKCKLLGEHNKGNILFVLNILKILDLNLCEINKSINEFSPLANRLEYVGKYKNIDFYNDSISTIPQSTIRCIEAIKGLTTLIIGGYDRGIEYNILIDYINKSDLKKIICLPDTGHIIGKSITKEVVMVDTLEDAIKNVYKFKIKNQICALSPAAASYNQFKNFEERGYKFKEYIVKYSESNYNK